MTAYPPKRQLFMKTSFRVMVATVVCTAACAAPVKVDKPRKEMSQREKDSVLAASSLPGSGVVKKAMAMSDVDTKHRAAIDSASNEN